MYAITWCPHCGSGPYRFTPPVIRSSASPIARRCGDCDGIVSLGKFAIEWELLSEWQRGVRYFSTGVVTTFGWGWPAVFFTFALFYINGVLFDPPPEPETFVFSSAFFLTWGAIASCLIVWNFRRYIRRDKKRSRDRLRDPEYRQLLRDTGWVLPAKWDQLDRNSRNDDVIDTLSETIRLYAGRADGHHSRGRAYYDNEQYALAIEDFTDAIKLDPDAQDAYYMRGAAHAHVGNYDLAIKDLTTAIILSREEWQKSSAFDLRGTVFQAMGEQAKATSDFAKAKELGSKG